MKGKNKDVLIKKDMNGNSIVLINTIIFKGRRRIDWNNVEIYSRQYIGKFYKTTQSRDIIYVGTDFADEFSGSNDTARLRGTLAKAKANAIQGIPELIKIASKKRYRKNLAAKHVYNARYGWYRYDSRFALPVYTSSNIIERYNIFKIDILVRHAQDGKMYLYDLVNIKKETSTPL